MQIKTFLTCLSCLWNLSSLFAQPWHELKVDIIPVWDKAYYTLSYEYQWHRRWSLNLDFQSVDRTLIQFPSLKYGNTLNAEESRQDMAMLSFRGYLISKNDAHNLFIQGGAMATLKPQLSSFAPNGPLFDEYPHGLFLQAGIGYKLVLWRKLVFEPSILLYRNEILFSPVPRYWTNYKTGGIIFFKLGYRFSHS
jgi:hypothetical protein